MATTEYVDRAVPAAAVQQSTDSVMLWSAAKEHGERLVGVLNGTFALQASNDGSTGWDFVDGGAGPFVPLEAVGPQKGDWLDVEALGLGERCLKIVTVAG